MEWPGTTANFHDNFSGKANPLIELTKKKERWRWSGGCEEALRDLKNALCQPPILAFPDKSQPYEVHTDASKEGLVAGLCQRQVNKERVIAYASRVLKPAERNCSTTEIECLVIIFATHKFRPYLYGQHFLVITDHNLLCWLMNVKNPNGRLIRWSLALQELDFSIKYRKGRKHTDDNGLSRAPVVEPVESLTSTAFCVVSEELRSAKNRDP